MRVKSHSLMLGYREFEASIRMRGGKPTVVLEQIGPLTASDYIKNGFSVKSATKAEIKGLIDGGYESRRLLLRHYQL
ncbi:MAG: hypothetical protein NXI24_07265 [bacterium]|nr:hypothetical protein [bacterium]